MSEAFELEAASRADVGKGASRRLRRLEGRVPAIVYGGKSNPVNITLDHDDLMHHLDNEAFFSHIINLKIDGAAESVLIKDLQRHPAKPRVMHADFLRVDANQAIVVNVPLHFINEEACHGVKMEGGRISHTMTQLEIRCLPGNLPEFIEVDMINVELGQVLHISDLKLPEGVESVALSHGPDHDLGVANVVAPKGGNEDDESTAEGEEGAGDAPAAEGDAATDS